MFKPESLKYSYDAAFDVLHVSFGKDGHNSYGDDSERGLIFLRDIDSDALTGLTVMNFLRKDPDSFDSLPAEVRDFLIGLQSDHLQRERIAVSSAEESRLKGAPTFTPQELHQRVEAILSAHEGNPSSSKN